MSRGLRTLAWPLALIAVLAAFSFWLAPRDKGSQVEIRNFLGRDISRMWDLRDVAGSPFDLRAVPGKLLLLVTVGTPPITLLETQRLRETGWTDPEADRVAIVTFPETVPNLLAQVGAGSDEVRSRLLVTPRPLGPRSSKIEDQAYFLLVEQGVVIAARNAGDSGARAWLRLPPRGSP